MLSLNLGERRTGVVLGSWKPETWHGGIVPAVIALESLGVKVLSPRDVRISNVTLSDNPDFFFLEADLEEVGVKAEEMQDLTYKEAAERLDFRRLENLLLSNLTDQGKSGLTYVVTPNGKLGKSTSCELTIAALAGNKLALSRPIEAISNETHQDVKNFLEYIIPQLPVISLDEIATYNRRNLIKTFTRPNFSMRRSQRYDLLQQSHATLLRHNYEVYQRPALEYSTHATRRIVN